MKYSSLLGLALLSIIIFSCSKKEVSSANVPSKDSVVTEQPKKGVVDTANVSIPTGDNSQTSVDWVGTYEATIPCADCSGIKSTLVLDKAGTFTLTEEYLDKNFQSKDEGKFVWFNNGGAIELQGKDAKYKYKVGENQLFQLNMDGTPITTSLKDHYIFKKK